MNSPSIDNSAISQLKSSDPRLGRLIETLPSPELDSSGDVYYDLVSCLFDQQIHYRTQMKLTSFWRFLDLFSGGYPHPQQLLNLPDETVLALKISGRKYQNMRALATWWLHEDEAQPWAELADDAVRERLKAVPGVGTWTAEMILLFTLQRPDIFPVDDYALKKAMIEHYGLTSEGKALKSDMEQIARAWMPHRSLACRYLWVSAQVKKTSKSL